MLRRCEDVLPQFEAKSVSVVEEEGEEGLRDEGWVLVSEEEVHLLTLMKVLLRLLICRCDDDRNHDHGKASLLRLASWFHVLNRIVDYSLLLLLGALFVPLFLFLFPVSDAGPYLLQF